MCYRKPERPGSYCVDIYGSGPAILFLPGWGLPGKIFDQIIVDLATEYTCLSIDLPGTGLSRRSSGEYSIDVIADDLKRLAVGRNLKQFSVIGWSVGANIAAEIALKAQSLISHLILVSPGLPKWTNSDGYENGIENRDTELMIAELARNRYAYLETLPSHWFKNGETAESRLYSRMLSESSCIIDDLLKSLKRHDMRESIKEIDTPTLIIWGRHDRSVKYEQIMDLHQLMPKSELAILENSAHAPLAEERQESTRVIRNFIRSH